jgi:hypothetical protein
MRSSIRLLAYATVCASRLNAIALNAEHIKTRQSRRTTGHLTLVNCATRCWYAQDNRAVVEALPGAVPLLMKLCAEPTTISDSSTSTTSSSVIATTTEQQQQLREGALRAMVSLTFVDSIALAVGYSQSSEATSSAADSVELAALSLHGAAVLVAVLREWNTATAAAAPAVTADAVSSSEVTAVTTAAIAAGETRAKLALLCLQNLSVHGACRRAVVDAGGVEALVAMHGCDDPTVR